MKLWLISQDKTRDYDTYDSAVVAAETSTEAIRMHPSGRWHLDWRGDVPPDVLVNLLDDEAAYIEWCDDAGYHRHQADDWCHPAHVRVRYIGETELPAGVICASFNAG